MSASNGKKYRGYLTWTDDMDQVLLDVLVEHHNNGDHTATGWKPHVYTAAVRNVREKCNVDITKDHVMSRCKTFDKHCNVLGRILAHDGFEWDQDRNKLVIHNEDAWSRYIEVGQMHSLLLICTEISLGSWFSLIVYFAEKQSCCLLSA
jgi:hypothetical protein